MKKRVLTLSLLALLMAGCKKSNNQEESIIVKDLSGTYVTSNTAIVKDPVMYTQNGTISTPAVIKSFIDRLRMQSSIIWDSKEMSVMPGLMNFKITDNSAASVDLSIASASGTVTTNIKFDGSISERTANDILIVAPKADTTIAYGTPVANQLDISKPYKVKDQFIALSTSTDLNRGYNISTKQLRLALIENELYLPMLVYSIKRVSNFGFASNSSNDYYLYNVVNPNITAELFSRDTVVIQQKYIKLIKQ